MSNKQIPEEVKGILRLLQDEARKRFPTYTGDNKDIFMSQAEEERRKFIDAGLFGYLLSHPPQQGSAVVYVPVEIKNDNDCPKIGRKVIIMRSNGTTRTNTWNNTLKNHYKAMGVTRWLKPVALSSLLPKPRPPQQGSAEEIKNLAKFIVDQSAQITTGRGEFSEARFDKWYKENENELRKYAPQPSGEAGAVESFLTSTIRSNGSQTDISKAAKLLKEHLLTIKNKGK